MSDVKVFSSIQEFITYRDSLRSVSVGLVPTMGALHQGHASLIERSAKENELTVLSIFVNPTQFNNPEDLKKYPRTFEADQDLAAESGAKVIIYPNYEDIYPDNYRYKLTEHSFSKVLCGAHRPGHFDGVLTVVLKLLQIAQPQKAYFGEKDYQQYQLIQDMAAAFFLRAQIVPCAIVREDDGLAMSSRNVRLSAQGRKKAPLIYKTLKDYADFTVAKEILAAEGIELEYLEEHFGRRFIAAYIDGVRLIDNAAI